MMIRSYLENDSNLKSQSDDTLSPLKDSYAINHTCRYSQQISVETTAIAIRPVKNELIFHEKDKEIDSEISFTKQQQALFAKTRLSNDDDSLSSTTTDDETDDWGDEYDDDESQCSTRAVSEGELFDDIAVEILKRNVHFGNATIREYSVTVGALTATYEPCPLQLSWDYNLVETQIDIDINESLKQYSRINSDRQSCRRLSLDERRLRIANVQDISLYEVQSLEFQAMMDQIKNEEDDNIRLR